MSGFPFLYIFNFPLIRIFNSGERILFVKFNKKRWNYNSCLLTLAIRKCKSKRITWRQYNIFPSIVFVFDGVVGGGRFERGKHIHKKNALGSLRSLQSKTTNENNLEIYQFFPTFNVVNEVLRKNVFPLALLRCSWRVPPTCSSSVTRRELLPRQSLRRGTETSRGCRWLWRTSLVTSYFRARNVATSGWGLRNIRRARLAHYTN